MSDKLHKYIHYGKKGLLLSKKLYSMEYRTRNDLIKHIKSKKLPILPNISQIYIKYNPIKKIKNSDALKIISSLKKEISKKYKLIPVGSIRREEKTHSDIDIIINIGSKLKNIDLTNSNLILVEGKKRHQRYIYKNKYLIDIFISTKKELPYCIFHYTGDKKYNIRTRAYAKKKGLLLNQYGLWRNNKLLYTNIKTEKELIKKLGVSYKEPKNRTL